MRISGDKNRYYTSSRLYTQSNCVRLCIVHCLSDSNCARMYNVHGRVMVNNMYEFQQGFRGETKEKREKGIRGKKRKRGKKENKKEK